MTKEMESYIKSVRRRLNLPKDVKDRVMSDFISSIRARQEAGQSDEQILADLGNARKAADDLNDQMKEFAYRKSPWRFAFLALAVYGGWKLLNGLWVQLLMWIFMLPAWISSRESASVGIIGGADGPTSIFITAPLWGSYLIAAVLMILGIWGFLRLRKCKK